jgi:hypothetical protein
MPSVAQITLFHCSIINAKRLKTYTGIFGGMLQTQISHWMEAEHDQRKSQSAR